MRVLVVYASDLDDPSRIAPGGITSNLRGYLDQLPIDWQIECWGVAALGMPAIRTIQLGSRTVLHRAIVTAAPPGQRRLPLSPTFTAALAWRAHRSLRASSYDVVIAHRTDYLPALTLATRGHHPPIVTMIHGSSEWAASHFRGLGLQLYMASEGSAMRHSAAIALVAGSSLPYYRSKYPHAAGKLRWIPNGVDTTRFVSRVSGAMARARFGVPPSKRVLVYHGRYDREKGIGRLLATLQALHAGGESDWHLLTAGIGPEQQQLLAAASTWAAGHLTDVGYLASADIPALLAAADVALLLSDFEGLSNGLLESLAAGLPVVATPAGDASIVLERLRGSLIESTDSAAIAATVRAVWQDRERLQPLALSTAERFSLAARGRRLTQLLTLTAAGRASEFPHEPV